MNTIPLHLPHEGLPLEQQVARLQALLEATRQVHSTIQPQEVLWRAASILVRELELKCALFLNPATDQAAVTYGDAPQPPYDGCIRFPLLSKDGQPLVELIVSPLEERSLSIYDQDFIEGLVLQTAVALENATLHERDLEWARVQQDLNAARMIQRSLLPRAMPEIASFLIAGRSTACYEVGGDYLDILTLSDGSHLFVVADVAGKGLASAIMATSFRSAFRSLAGQPLPLEELVARMNQQHWAEGDEARRRYVTAIFLRLDPRSASVDVVNAGHNPGALVFPDGSTHFIEASGTPLGILPGMSYRLESFDFPPGSRALLYTDGLTEVFQGEEEFGSERLLEALQQIRSTHAESILDSLWETLLSFTGNAAQSDDMTAVAICHLEPSSQESPTS